MSRALRVNQALFDYERKRARAMLHFNALFKTVERAINVHSEPVRGKVDADSGKYVFEMPLERLSRDTPLRVGEYVYNTRASLDYLISALVRSTGKEENNRNQFPIWGVPDRVGWQDVADWWETAREVTRQLKNTPPQTRTALKQLQPFYGVPVTNPAHHPLFALMELSNRDKHRRLNLLARVPRFEFVNAEGHPVFDGPPFGLEGRITETYERNTYTVTLDLTEKTNVDVYLLATYDVGLHEPPELIGGLVETMRGINEFIDGRVFPTVKSLL